MHIYVCMYVFLFFSADFYYWREHPCFLLTSLGVRPLDLQGQGSRRSVLLYPSVPPTLPIAKDAESCCGLARLQHMDWATASVGGSFQGSACLGMASCGNFIFSPGLLWKFAAAHGPLCIPTKIQGGWLGQVPPRLRELVLFPVLPYFFPWALLSMGKLWAFPPAGSCSLRCGWALRASLKPALLLQHSLAATREPPEGICLSLLELCSGAGDHSPAGCELFLHCSWFSVHMCS